MYEAENKVRGNRFPCVAGKELNCKPQSDLRSKKKIGNDVEIWDGCYSYHGTEMQADYD